MDLIQTRAKAWEAGGRAGSFGPALFIAAVIVTVISAAILATTLTAAPPAGSDIGFQTNPLVQPALVELRRGEHAAGVSQTNPLVQPALVEFRRGEHAAGATR